MKIFIGSDHAGFRLKEAMKQHLNQLDVDFEDLGNIILDKNDDYPDFSLKVAQAVAQGKIAKGILFCGSAAGACITANKVKGIRAASVRSEGEARLAREHDDTNIICLAGGDQIQKTVQGLGVPPDIAKKIITTWLKTSFSTQPRHKRRVNKIKRIEDKNFKK